MTTGETNEPVWLQIARAELAKGIRRPWKSSLPLVKKNPEILKYLAITALPAELKRRDNTPWCAAAVSWIFLQGKVPAPITAWAKDWLKYGEPLATPRVGALAIFRRGRVGGHVGFYIGETAEQVLVLGGNQKKAWRISPFPKADLLGYRWPVSHLPGGAVS